MIACFLIKILAVSVYHNKLYLDLMTTSGTTMNKQSMSMIGGGGRFNSRTAGRNSVTSSSSMI